MDLTSSTMSSVCWYGRAGVLMTAALLFFVLVAHTNAVPLAKRDIGDLLEGKDKRPFCNAFTGCGKKRSDPGVEGVASSSELDALAKHVLAEAKLWEQLQTKMEVMRSLAARMENNPLYRRKRSLPHQPRHNLTSTPKQKVNSKKQ
ncbi:cardioactive peptide isoform X2 [Cherax quadricarinatus]|uniref:cardioactive peptide isoform X2 n=1 Tax=Cherax quadricarinatus TaxID=27406 RepID=UPI00387E5279